MLSSTSTPGLRASSGSKSLAAARHCPGSVASGRSRRQVVVEARGRDRRRPPPPDLPSLLFDQRIVYLGMPLVPAVTELMVAELLYLEKQGNSLPIEMLINSSGTTRQDGEILAFDSEGIALTSTMGFIKNPISTVNMGLAVGWSAVVLSFGKKGWRKSLPHSLAMIQQPRVPPTGQRQAIEVHIKWREVLDYKRDLLRCLSIGTGWPVAKLDADMQRPLYMRPKDALEYGLIDTIIEPDREKEDAAVQYWIKSGRAESEDRLQQWKEAVELQEKYALKDAFNKVRAEGLRDAYREARTSTLADSPRIAADIAAAKERMPKQMLAEDDQMRLPFSKEGLKLALLNAERYAERNVQRQVKAGGVALPEQWERSLEAGAAQQQQQEAQRWPAEVDYAALIRQIDRMDADSFKDVDLDSLMEKFAVNA